MKPGDAVALIVYENTWAGPFVSAMRRAGASVVASARIPADEVVPRGWTPWKRLTPRRRAPSPRHRARRPRRSAPAPPPTSEQGAHDGTSAWSCPDGRRRGHRDRRLEPGVAPPGRALGGPGRRPPRRRRTTRPSSVCPHPAATTCAGCALTPTPTSRVCSSSVRLRASGVLTEAEFQAQKPASSASEAVRATPLRPSHPPGCVGNLAEGEDVPAEKKRAMSVRGGVPRRGRHGRRRHLRTAR